MTVSMQDELVTREPLSFDAFREEVLNDFKKVCESRQASLLGRREVLTGKAKFGIFGDGKEVPQVAMAKFFKPGDFYAGYYRDQTFAFATGSAKMTEFFAQLYADPNPNHEPHSMGRQMNAHYASRFFDEDGNILDLVNRKNLSAGMAPTAGHLPRALGLALASKLFRQMPGSTDISQLSHRGDEVCFCTIGDASTSEGHFWEMLNAAAVQRVPLAIFIWDDGYGISVPKEYQTCKGSISEALSGFKRQGDSNGIDIYKVKAWDYAGLCEVFEEGIEKVRATHIPALFHVEEVTQPQGHSTSGSHERYKPAERLEWEREWDCIRKMKEWILTNELADEEELLEMETTAKKEALVARKQAWDAYGEPVRAQVEEVKNAWSRLADHTGRYATELQSLFDELFANKEPLRRDVLKALRRAICYMHDQAGRVAFQELLNRYTKENDQLYHSFLYHANSATDPDPVAAEYDESEGPLLNGYEILNRYFDKVFEENPMFVAFGEDVGQIGDVNQGFAGLQEKYGKRRIFDTGIRELTIMGQGIGLAMRGFRPIAEIQYLDYLLYGLQPLSDDLATLHFRTAGQQSAPLIVRTRGHRLEGIWHSGSPMAVVINALRGMHVCVPRNMVQAIGMYNTLLDGKDPGLVIECLNGYRLKERLPVNLTSIRVPLGVPEIVREGSDLTIVSYGSMLRIIDDAAQMLEGMGIGVEVIDVQTLVPFDTKQLIVQSLQKTGRILFADEDVPGGASAYMFTKVIEEQHGYRWLDAAPRTLSASEHRPGYGSDGDYFGKPNAEDIIELVVKMMAE